LNHINEEAFRLPDLRLTTGMVYDIRVSTISEEASHV
jgi:hypothetical protein